VNHNCVDAGPGAADSRRLTTSTTAGPFEDGIAPLREANKLGVIVLQLPKWVFSNKEAKATSKMCGTG
jgi:hypothetical protein